MSAETSRLLVLLFWAVVGTTVFALMLIAAASMLRGRYRRALQSVAQEYGGTIYQGGLDNIVDQVTFTYRGAAVIVLNQSVHGLAQVLISTPNPRLRMALASDEPIGPLQELFGMQDIEVGQPAFDKPYIVRGDDVAAVRQFLTPAVQVAAINLLAFKPPHWINQRGAALHVQLGPELLAVSRGTPVSDAAELLGFVRAALAFYDAAADSLPHEGMELVLTSTTVVPHCMVCGAELVTDIVYCRRCKTPHHRECWEYSGNCSTYGCRETQYLVPQHQPLGGRDGNGPTSQEPLWPRPGKPR